jgi:hypothetical protein
MTTEVGWQDVHRSAGGMSTLRHGASKQQMQGFRSTLVGVGVVLLVVDRTALLAALIPFREIKDMKRPIVK